MNIPNSIQYEPHLKGNYGPSPLRNAFINSHEVSTSSLAKFSVKLKVADSQTGAPVKGVLACIVSAENLKGTIFKSTAEQGSLKIQLSEAGAYQITLKKAGYASQCIELNLNGTHRSVVNINLESS